MELVETFAPTGRDAKDDDAPGGFFVGLFVAGMASLLFWVPLIWCLGMFG